MPDPLACIGETARELKERYGDLLRPRGTEPDQGLIQALDGVREHLCYQRDPYRHQMTLDFRGGR